MPDLADLYPGFGSHTASTDAGRIFARTGGSGPPLVLVHGFPETGAMWHRVAPKLAERFSLVIPDLRGYGWSSAPASLAGEGYSKRAMGRDIVALMEDLGHARFAYVGHDRGARVGYRLALDQPGRIAKLALLDIIPTEAVWQARDEDPSVSPHWPWLARPEPEPETAIARDPDRCFEELMAKWVGPGGPAAFDARAMAHYRAAWGDPSRIHAMCEDYRAGATVDREADRADVGAGKTIGCPVLVIASRHLAAPRKAAPVEVWRSGFAPEAEGVSVDCGHFVAEENPEAVLAALERFLLTEASGIGLALGAGGARGLAHVVVLEAFDELGIRPAAIAGTSIGAIIGAAYAAGLSGRDLRGQLLRMLGRRHRALSALFDARVGRFTQVLRGGLTNPVLVDAEVVLSAFWPAGLPDRIEDLAIPFTAIATDFHGRTELVLRTGSLRGAVAASMAIPGLVRPVLHEGRTLVDGAATNPLPYDRLPHACRALVACDVVAGPVGDPGTVPSPFEAMFGSAQIMQLAITAKMLRERAPHLLLRPEVSGFKVLDFFAFSRILRAAEADKDAIKRSIEKLADPQASAER